jgi:uncharacterized damage-inducible protein DinB
MTSMKQALAWDLAYSGWANRKLIDICWTLTREELNRDLGSSHGSVIATLRHIYYTERVWLWRLRTDAMPRGVEIGDQSLFRDPDPEPNLVGLNERWPDVSGALSRYLESMPGADLEDDLRGPDAAMPKWKLLLHLVNHSTLHRGQVVSMVRQLGKKPPNVDIMTFHFEAS